jgi:hypothetical protein
MTKKTDFTVYETNHGARYAMAYTCTCGKASIGYSDDAHGLFFGTCSNGHEVTVMAS